MDVQLKKGLLEAYVLSLLKKGPAYGYKLFDDVSSKIQVSSSTLYPILRRLEQQQCLETYQEEYLGRLRKYYRITDLGIERFEEYKIMCEEMKAFINAIMGDDENE